MMQVCPQCYLDNAGCWEVSRVWVLGLVPDSVVNHIRLQYDMYSSEKQEFAPTTYLEVMPREAKPDCTLNFEGQKPYFPM